MKGLQKYKKLIITLSIVLGVVLIAVILNFTLFSLRTVEIDFKNQPQIFTEESKKSIANNDTIKMGTSVFALSKKNITKQLERDNPYLKVINIETVFPNKIVIHCAEREETYAVKASDTKYFICDAEFKVLNIQTSYFNEQYNAILFKGLENIISNTNRVNAGEFLEFTSESEILKNIGSSLLLTNKSVAYQRGLIESIELTSGIYPFTATNLPYLRFKDFNGFVTNVYKLESLLVQKFQYMFASIEQVIYNPREFFKKDLQDGTITLDEIKPDYYLDYTLEIRENLSNGLIIRLEKIG